MPNITIEVEQVQTATLSGGATIKLDLSAMHPLGVAAIVRYGAQRIINDAANAGGKDSTPDERMALGEKKLLALIEGTVSMRSGGSSLDPVEKEIRAIIQSKLQAKGHKVADAKKAAKDWRNIVDEAAHEKLTAVAKKNVAARQIDIELEID